MGDTACRTIIETASPAGALAPGAPKSVTLASTFCIPRTFASTSDVPPGPGAVSLPGTFTIE